MSVGPVMGISSQCLHLKTHSWIQRHCQFRVGQAAVCLVCAWHFAIFAFFCFTLCHSSSKIQS